jgi:hypothetical protein
MFNYIIGSINPIPNILAWEGIWLANNSQVIWAWFNTNSHWSEEMTFFAKIDKHGPGNINLTVIASKVNDDSYDEAYDSIQITAEKSKSLCTLSNFIRRYFREHLILLDGHPLILRFYEKLLKLYHLF